MNPKKDIAAKSLATIVVAACALLGAARAEDSGLASRAADLVLSTPDARWEGAAARLQVFGPAAGRPAVARLSFDAGTDGGRRLGVYAELAPEQLLGGSWRVALDGGKPTAPLLGVLTHGTAGRPVVAGSGTLALDASRGHVSGTLTSDVPALRSATISGSYVVECFVGGDEMGLPANGSLQGGQVLANDEAFRTEFCRRFQGL